MKMLKLLLISVLILSISIKFVTCARILEIFNLPSKSCHLAGVRMAEILTEKGHKVTIVSGYQITPPPKNFEHIFLEEIDDFHNDATVDLYDWNTHPIFQAHAYTSLGIRNCNITMHNSKFGNVLKSGGFDLVILQADFSESLTYIARYLNVPILLYTSIHSSSWSNHFVGNSAPPSYIPNVLSHYTRNMIFFQRMENEILSLHDEYLRYFYVLPQHDKIVKKNFPGAPDIEEYINKAGILLMNSDISVYDPVPTLPGMIDIGGFHIKTPKELSKDLEELMNGAKDGVIYFSMGSSLRSSKMPENMVRVILKVFSKLKQTVLWKWEDKELPGKPDNVIIRKWFPQNDILAHKNTKLFITHGGFHSILETVHYGIPCVTLAVFADQIPNAIRAAEFGFAEWMNFKDVTLQKFEWAVTQVLNNEKYTKAAKKRSNIMRDKLASPAKTLTFWVDYVIRHKGAEHFKVASLKLNWYQYFFLDVIGALCIVFVLFVIMIKYIFKVLIERSKKEPKQKIQ